MHYLKSTTRKAYVFDGKKIPQAITKDNEFLALTDKEYAEFQKKPVIASLIKSGAVFVTQTAPSKPEDQLKTATQENARLILENTRLQDELAKAQASSGSTEVEELKAALAKQVEESNAALAKQVEEDKAEILALQKEKDKEIAELKKQLAKAQKGE